jgi:hypothetical protein
MNPKSDSGGTPQKPIAKRPVANRPVASRPAQNPVAKPVAQKPVAQRPVVATPLARPPQPVSPAHPPRVSSRKESGASWITTVVFLAMAGGGAWWFLNREKPAPQIAAPPVIVPAVEEKKVVVPTPAPVLVEAKPVAPPVPTPIPAAPAPMPIAQPTPAPLPVVAAVDPYAAPLSLDAVAARSPAIAERAASLIRSALQNNEVPKYLDLLERSMAIELKRTPDFATVQRYDRFFENPFFMRAFLQHAMLSLAGDAARKEVADSSLLSSHLTKLGENNAAMEAFLETVTPRDKFIDVMTTWAGIAADDSEAIGAYRDLAIACSLVFEKPLKFDWNGHETTITAAERYQWYKKYDKAGQLETNLTKLSAWELSWVVGARIPESEMEWTRSELRRKLKQSNWGSAYGMIKYDMEKAVTGKMKDPYDYYTFAEILKKGGICGDQSYFASNTARSVGIPAISISGDGPQGPHAWMAWLSDDDKWSFSGRFGGYPAGRVSDPRNGESISENVFTRLSDSHVASRQRALKSKRLVWLSDLHLRLKQEAIARQAVQFAISNTPYEPELWQRKIALMAASKPELDVAEWKSFLDLLRRKFADDPDMLAKARAAEDKHVFPRLSIDSAKNELRGDIRHLGNLKGLTSTEEILAAHKRYADVFLKSKDYAGVRRIYREALDDYGREPSKFKALAHDYWSLVRAAGSDIRLAACRDLERSYERHVETKTGAYFDVKSQASAARVVASCWRDAGDIARADRMEKEIAKREEKATKDAL